MHSICIGESASLLLEAWDHGSLSNKPSCMRRCCVQVIRRIDVPPRDVKWSDNGELVALIGEASFYVLRFDRAAVEVRDPLAGDTAHNYRACARMPQGRHALCAKILELY